MWKHFLIKKKWKTLDFFESPIQHYKMAATSCYIFRYFGLRTGLNLATHDCPRTNVTSGGRVYFRPLMSSKSHRKPRVELTFYSGLQFFGFSSSSFTKSAEFVSLPEKASLVSISGAVLFV